MQFPKGILKEALVAALGLYVAIVVLRLDYIFFAIVLAPETVLWLSLFALALIVRLYWVAHSDEELPGKKWNESEFLYADKTAQEEGHVALKTAMNALYLLGTPSLDSRFVFWLNELLRISNPLPAFLAEPTMKWTWGDEVPSVMHLRRLSSTLAADELVFALDFVYTGDAHGTLSALSVSVELSNIKLAGTILIRLNPLTGELFMCLESTPMLNLKIAVNRGPDVVRLQVLEWIEAQLEDRVQTWTHLGMIGEAIFGNLQHDLTRLGNLAVYNKAASLALEAGVARMTARKSLPTEKVTEGEASTGQEEEELNLEGFEIVQSRPAPPEASPTAVTVVGTPIVFNSDKSVLCCDSFGHLRYFAEDSNKILDVTAGLCAIDHSKGIAFGEDSVGKVVAAVSNGKCLLMTWRNEAKLWIWREVDISPHAIIGFVMHDKHIWHLIFSDAFGNIIDCSLPAWNANQAPQITSLGQGATASLLRPDGLVVFSPNHMVVLRLEGNHFKTERQESWSMRGKYRIVTFSWRNAFHSAHVHDGKLYFGNNFNVTEMLHKQGSTVSDLVGTPHHIILRGDLILVFRDIMGLINVIVATKPEKMKHYNLSLLCNLKADEISCWDVFIAQVGIASMRIVWAGADGQLHKLSGTSALALTHSVMTKH